MSIPSVVTFLLEKPVCGLASAMTADAMASMRRGFGYPDEACSPCACMYPRSGGDHEKEPWCV